MDKAKSWKKFASILNFIDFGQEYLHSFSDNCVINLQYISEIIKLSGKQQEDCQRLYTGVKQAQTDLWCGKNLGKMQMWAK